MPKIEAADFSKEVNKILQDYGQHARQALDEAIPVVADQATQELKGAGTFNGTKYRRSWTSKIEETRLGVNAVVYNRRQYRLTHLLEFGHAKQNGGRTRSFPHIAPINNKVGDEVVKELEERL